MNDFHEAVLTFDVPAGMGQVYKKAIEDDNSRHWIKNKIKDADGNIVISDIKPSWNGNHCSVSIDNSLTIEKYSGAIIDRTERKTHLTIALISRTLPNLKEQVEWYERMGAKVIRTNYKGENQNGNDQN
ncbi:hypothetical protein [Enterococcus faecium]|uniref:hypothetical protein n=1 Tax=Enterococcus faecium TaxID=1352 RepID=UPI00259CA97A|nr:hypothetical protein [Enterococcus faecium]MDM4735318.1 hypothetical protein [Enterococcus faecium]MDM4742866.1 hypothetical protein [Enterococcus faecium]MDM4750290.1 hypothetical protein [Enterococcus faecium]